MSWSNLVTTENTNQHIIDVFTNPKILTLDNVIAITEISSDNAAYSFYPNPARGTVNIKGPAFTRLEVLDLSGRVVYSTNHYINSIQTESMASGVYIVRIVGNNAIFQQKLVVCD
jgi:hypothetical protein